jgi:hypothetical protein
MIRKIKAAGIGVALVAALLSGGSANAQLAVFDGANVAQTAQAVVTAGKELLQLQQQLTQLEQTYRMFTNGSNVTGMMPQLNTGFLQNPMPQSSQMPNLIIGGTGTMSGPAQSFYNQNHIYTATGSDPFAANLNNSARALANIQGIAATMQRRLAERDGVAVVGQDLACRAAGSDARRAQGQAGYRRDGARSTCQTFHRTGRTRPQTGSQAGASLRA